MALTLEQFASYLDTRDLPWPAAPEIDRPRAKPHLVSLKGIRVVLWNVYGTLLNLYNGELLFEHPQKLLMDVALDKTVQEFKMWSSMTRKPGQPSEYMAQIYSQVLAEQRGITTGGEKYPEVQAERIWEAILKKLLQKDYKFDAGFYGALNELSRKIAYFFHASLQGTTCYPGCADALKAVADAGRQSGLLGDGQCFTAVQLARGLKAQDEEADLEPLVPPSLRFLSCDVRAKKPAERLFRHAMQFLAEKKIMPGEVLHVGSRLTDDLVPARRMGMKTALFAGDRASLEATPEQLKETASRPDVLLTELNQIADVLG
jgi:FMN phosphatase YigB (HAD superfamily)